MTDSTSTQYGDTVLLPKTAFPLRADAVKREHQYRERCTSFLYAWQRERETSQEFILHDGPPYANGNLHLGHALNKILKDVINRYQLLQGKKVHYVPGWDCHGLPIEQKALESLKKDHRTLSAVEIREAARQRALSEVEKQRKDFMSWCIMGDWDHPYKTLNLDFELRQLQLFHDMVEKGYIYRQLKPVYWSPSSRTALAEAELEYNDEHKSRSIYVKLPVVSSDLHRSLPEDAKVYLLVWTTTPWTMPANRAVSINPEIDYVLAKGGDKEYFVVAKDREGVLQQSGAESESLEISALTLLQSRYRHPLTGNLYPILAGSHVTAESGTGLVHTAPGHGMEDYEVCLKHGILPFSPVDEDGMFTTDAGAGLAGKCTFTEGNAAVIDMLRQNNLLYKEELYTHKYPYDWRTKKPVMLRATAQWFANLTDLQQDGVNALSSVQMIPETSRHRLTQFTLSRKEWCISRQRAWGVPIPVLYGVKDGKPLLTSESISHIISVFEQRGTDLWWTEPNDEVFIAPTYRQGEQAYKRGYDTMDVWFDSGTSWTMLGKDQRAQVYLEGSDQHRGWFQSSLLTSVASRGHAPYEKLITHGFVLDEQGRKMAKSLGNIVEPSVIVHGGKINKKQSPPYGTDILRLWVASTEFTRDVTMGPTILAHIAESMRKIRTTARFMLGNLHDFRESDLVAYEGLRPFDKYMLGKLSQFIMMVENAYESFAFNQAVQAFHNFNNNVLSATYFDVIKDRLYNEATNATSRRSAQTVLYHILKSYTVCLAPIACHTSEEIYEHMGSILDDTHTSVFQNPWPRIPSQWNADEELQKDFDALLQLKTSVNQVLESMRQEKLLTTSQGASLSIICNEKTPDFLSKHADDLSDINLVSSVEILISDQPEESMHYADHVTSDGKGAR
ncbi:hypothetical protein BZG36_04805 [Bifiguratus adelaidae]|uniref:isoleucine--tRNA ligase n=1 Tax=Bifiguratus adelaidae TaxID=1938954 RepID=A0A261XUY0_9FUNG|nr:hypothetical protein BZG36_04805 [Bifiguratus adelaidae]